MGREMILEYCNFLKDMGMFFQDGEMVSMLQTYFQNNYYDFELTEIFQLMKLNSYCFYQSKEFLESLQDSVSVRIKEKDQLSKLQVSDVLDFIEALSIGNRENKLMSGNLVKTLKQTPFLKEHDQVPLYAVSYLSDFELKTSEGFAKRIEDSLIKHLDKYDIKELSYLLISL